MYNRISPKVLFLFNILSKILNKKSTWQYTLNLSNILMKCWTKGSFSRLLTCNYQNYSWFRKLSFKHLKIQPDFWNHNMYIQFLYSKFLSFIKIEIEMLICNSFLQKLKCFTVQCMHFKGGILLQRNMPGVFFCLESRVVIWCAKYSRPTASLWPEFLDFVQKLQSFFILNRWNMT